MGDWAPKTGCLWASPERGLGSCHTCQGRGSPAGEWSAPEKGCSHPGRHSCGNPVHLAGLLLFMHQASSYRPHCALASGRGVGPENSEARLAASEACCSERRMRPGRVWLEGARRCWGFGGGWARAGAEKQNPPALHIYVTQVMRFRG